MEIRSNADEIQQLMEQNHICEYIGIGHEAFHVRQYDKGEILCSPVRSLDCLLFLVEGSVQLYTLHQNGSKVAVGMDSALKLFGDMEFCTGKPSAFFVEAMERVVCLALPIQEYRQELYEDVKFLRYLICLLSEKVLFHTDLAFSSPVLEDKVMLYLFNVNPEHEIRGIEAAALRLRCSRRQLQRVLKKMCDNNQVKKTGRGKYQLNLEQWDSSKMLWYSDISSSEDA
ncbi:MAG: cyclic nucleotide-binding domain-containing protein [Massiliimalia sp.]